MTVYELMDQLKLFHPHSHVYIEGVGRNQQTLLTGVDMEYDGRRTSVILTDYKHDEKTPTS